MGKKPLGGKAFDHDGDYNYPVRGKACAVSALC